MQHGGLKQPRDGEGPRVDGAAPRRLSPRTRWLAVLLGLVAFVPTSLAIERGLDVGWTVPTVAEAAASVAVAVLAIALAAALGRSASGSLPLRDRDNPAANEHARHDAEDALRLSEQRYRAILETQTEYVCRWTPDKRLTYVNEAYCRCFGKTRDELIGQSFEPLITEEDRGAVRDALSELTPDHPSATAEHRVLALDGSVRWQRWASRAILGPDGRVVECQSVGVDITELKNSALDLRASMSRFQALAELAPVAIFQTDEHGANVYVNKHWSRLTGLSCEEGLGYGWRRAIHPDDLQSLSELWRESFAKGGPFSTEYRYLRPDGSVVWVYAVAMRVKDGSERVTGVLGAAMDISALKATQQRLNQSLDHAKQLGERERAMRRELDHRVRNNLASLLGLIRLYARSDDPEALSKVEGKVRAMSKVHDMLAGAEGRDVEVVQIVRRLAALILGDAAAHCVEIESEHGAIPPSRASALAMIVQELLTNSIKHGAMRGAGDPQNTGRIRVWWSSLGSDKGFEFTWHEQLGPCQAGSHAGPRVVKEPATSIAGADAGIGMSLIRGLAESELQGRCRFEFGPDGLRFELHSTVCLCNDKSGPILCVPQP